MRAIEPCLPARHRRAFASHSSKVVGAMRAATSHDSAAFRKVLARAGCVSVGPATAADVGGGCGTWCQRAPQP